MSQEERDMLAREYAEKHFAHSTGALKGMAAEIFAAGWDARDSEVTALTKERDELKHYRTRLEMYDGIARDCARERDELRAIIAEATKHVVPGSTDHPDAYLRLLNDARERADRKDETKPPNPETIALKRETVRTVLYEAERLLAYQDAIDMVAPLNNIISLLRLEMTISDNSKTFNSSEACSNKQSQTLTSSEEKAGMSHKSKPRDTISDTEFMPYPPFRPEGQ